MSKFRPLLREANSAVVFVGTILMDKIEQKQAILYLKCKSLIALNL